MSGFVPAVRKTGSLHAERRWALITAYRNPGAPLDPETGIAVGFPNWMTPNYRDAPTPGLAPCHKRWD